MLLRLENGIKIIFLLFLTDVAARSTDREFLSRLLYSRNNGPVVVFLDRGASDNMVTSYTSTDTKDRTPNVKYEPTPGENDAYLLYNALRTTQEDEVLDTKAARIFEKTKNLLREAFVLRCEEKKTCTDSCSEKKEEDSSGCEANCKKVFDELDACDEKPSCDGKNDDDPKCGKTMPPKWLRMLIRGGESRK